MRTNPRLAEIPERSERMVQNSMCRCATRSGNVRARGLCFSPVKGSASAKLRNQRFWTPAEKVATIKVEGDDAAGLGRSDSLQQIADAGYRCVVLSAAVIGKKGLWHTSSTALRDAKSGPAYNEDLGASKESRKSQALITAFSEGDRGGSMLLRTSIKSLPSVAAPHGEMRRFAVESDAGSLRKLTAGRQPPARAPSNDVAHLELSPYM